MAGTKAGGKAAAETNKEKYGADFYSKIGAKGGKGYIHGVSPPKGLASMTPERLREISIKGGTKSRRGKTK